MVGTHIMHSHPYSVGIIVLLVFIQNPHTYWYVILSDSNGQDVSQWSSTRMG